MVSTSEHDTDTKMTKEGDISLPSSPEWDVSYAGVVRYTISSMLKRSVKFLRRGLRVRPRTLAHSTDRLKELVEFREHYLTAHEGHEGAHSPASTTEPTTSQSEVKRSRFRQIAREVLPGFIKHVGFATIVFSSYETIYDDYYLDYQHEVHSHSQSSNFDRKFISLAGPFLCGGVSGTLGGIYYVTWDKIAGAWHRSRGTQPAHAHSHAMKSVIASHTLVQSTLFSSYEVMKWFSLHSQLHRSLSVFCDNYLPTWISLDHGDHSSSSAPTKFSAFRHHGYPNSFAADVLSIVFCGATAGAVSETMQHWIKLYDLLRSNTTQKEELYQILRQSGGVIQRLSNYRHVFLPSSHSAINAALPMSLAFLAYEYGKAVSAHEQHHNPAVHQ